MKVTKGYVNTPDGQVHYREIGAGPAVMMLHQTPTSGDDYSRVMPLLGHRFRCVAPDMMGYGMSDIPERVFEIEDYAQTVLQVMDSLGIDSASFVGHHTGAILAVHLAAIAPARVKKLFLSGSPGWDEKKRMESLSHPAYKHVTLDEAGEFLMRKWNLYKSFCAEGTKSETWYPAFTASVMSGTRVHDGHVAAFKYDILARYPLLKQPVKLVCGEWDEFIGELESTSKLIPGCQYEMVKGGGTVVSLEAPANFANSILSFF